MRPRNRARLRVRPVILDVIKTAEKTTDGERLYIVRQLRRRKGAPRLTPPRSRESRRQSPVGGHPRRRGRSRDPRRAATGSCRGYGLRSSRAAGSALVENTTLAALAAGWEVRDGSPAAG